MALHRGAELDAVVVGSGPNGLAAAIRLAQEGLSVKVFDLGTVGGGTRTEELTLPGYLHDVCSAVHPLAAASPFFSTLPLQEHGLELIHPEIPLAHPLPDGTAAVLERSVAETALLLGQDAAAYRRFFGFFTDHWDDLAAEILSPLHIPRRPFLFAAFGAASLLPATTIASGLFRTSAPKALFLGMAAHSFLPLNRPLSGAFALILATLGHAAGWPIVKGGSHALARALANYLRSLGGTIETGIEIGSLDELPDSRAALLDVTPRQLLRIVGKDLPDRYRRKLENYRYGPGVFKVDWALAAPIPWRAAECRRSATVHLGGWGNDIVASEAEVWQGRHPEQPFVLLSQPTLFDPTRAPADRHVGWAYCHVPNGSTRDMCSRIEEQVERFAPGFRELILARRTRNCLDYERINPNLVGGDINGGLQDLRQFLARPTLLSPYRTPKPGLYLCSSSTPPGGGVHGMCGFHAAQAVIEDLF